MRLNQFRFEFNRVNFFQLCEGVWMYRKPIEIWHERTDELIRFKSVDEALDYSVNGTKVREIIDKMEHLPSIELKGGRGASSDASNKTFKFGHAKESFEGQKTLLPAKMNTKIKTKNPEDAIAYFNKEHQNSDHEWSVEVDDQGFIHQYNEGNKHSVWGKGTNTSRNRKTIIVHNHPSGGHFSDKDLLNAASDRNANGVIASPSKKNYYYKFEKGSHFKPNEFSRAIRNARMKGKSYDDAVDKWLTKHAKKFGYKYSKVKK